MNDTELDGRRRAFAQVRHEGSFGSYWTSEIDASRVSDEDYFADLGNSLQLASITHLDRRADLRFKRGPLAALVRFQSYQTVDEDIPADERPYQRLPQSWCILIVITLLPVHDLMCSLVYHGRYPVIRGL